MKLELTKEEFERLLQVVYAGNWLINGLREDPLDDFLNVEQKVFELSREMNGGTELVKWDKKYQQYLPSAKLESMMEELIDDYDENLFWNELIQRMAARDILAEKGEDAVEAMDETEENELLHKYSEPYSNAFETHGIRDLKLTSVD